MVYVLIFIGIVIMIMLGLLLTKKSNKETVVKTPYLESDLSDKEVAQLLMDLIITDYNENCRTVDTPSHGRVITKASHFNELAQNLINADLGGRLLGIFNEYSKLTKSNVSTRSM